MLVASASTFLNQFGFSANNAVLANKQGHSLADAIAQANASAAAKRKEMAEQQLKMLAQRLRILMLFSATDKKGNKGYGASAAGIAKEIAQAVRDYADASGAEQSASANQSSDPSSTQSLTQTSTMNPASPAVSTQGLSNEDESFLNTAIQLSYQVKAIIAEEARKARRNHLTEEQHQGAINQMNDAIVTAAKSLTQNDTATPIDALGSTSTFAFVV
jgi:hypothetical protein